MPDPKTKRQLPTRSTRGKEEPKPTYEQLLDTTRQQHQLLGERFELIQMYEGQDQRAELAQRNGQLVQQVADLKKQLEAAQSATREAVDNKNAMRHELFQAHQNIARLEGQLSVLDTRPREPSVVERVGAVERRSYEDRHSAMMGHASNWLTR